MSTDYSFTSGNSISPLPQHVGQSFISAWKCPARLGSGVSAAPVPKQSRHGIVLGGSMICFSELIVVFAFRHGRLDDLVAFARPRRKR